jgi:5-methyltetrahydrofolate--homocysteine methyltransferase
LARARCELPLVASMTFSPEPSGRYGSIMGEAPGAVVALAERYGCAACGTNCGQGIETMPPLVGQLAALTELPDIAQPNAGLPRLVGGQAVYGEGASVFALQVARLHEAGARIIGGCDGTTAEHVRVLRRFADSL